MSDTHDQEGSKPWLRFGATEALWRDWAWQQRHAIRTAEQLVRFLEPTPSELEGIARAPLPFAVTPYYLSLADPRHPCCPVRRQAIPTAAETRRAPGELVDPLGEETHRPTPAIIHKYPDRVLLLAVERCSVYCRHCTRRRLAGSGRTVGRRELDEAIAYITRHPAVRDVLLSGGDPLLMSDERLDELLGRLRAIPHVEIVRIGSRMPVVNPMRITPALASVLRRHGPLFLVTHFNHPKEVTADARRACEVLVDAGVPVENQTVLLRGINSSARLLTDLSHRLLRMRVRPYYLHQLDLAEGIEHFRTPLEAGVQILEAMRGFTSGLAIPHLAVDLPKGGGKVTLQPDYRVSTDATGTVFRGYRGGSYHYPEPPDPDCSCAYEEVWYRATEC